MDTTCSNTHAAKLVVYAAELPAWLFRMFVAEIRYGLVVALQACNGSSHSRACSFTIVQQQQWEL